ncbi:caspase-7-like [Octopus sinensis]|uniref:Caspase-7-like n=1 Tax=Octopus sinensis TaxID=2607531 RepID=A0A6P7TX29_9MOLL|nr:caspase-7-like [Octopus sinensis]
MENKTRVAYIVDPKCSTNDAADFRRALERIGFKCEPIYNDFETMCKDLEKFKETERKNKIGCFICAVINQDHEKAGSDVIALTSKLTADKCQSLKGVPKLIFIEAVEIVGRFHAVDAPETGNILKIPITADLLVFRSWRKECLPIHGKHEASPFMKILTENLNEYGTKYEILKLLTITSGEFQSSENSKNNGSERKTQIASTLLKELMF